MNEPCAQVNDISIRFGSYTALTGVCFPVMPGDFITVIGPNGGGKTTLLKALLGLTPLSAGDIVIPGGRRGLAYVPQFKTMDRRFPAVAEELVASGMTRRWPAFMGSGTRQKAREALAAIGAQRLCGRSVSALSGGELQRVFLARAMVSEPRVLLLDEPATGIDAVGEADMYRLLEEFQTRSGAAILLVTHDWHAVRHHCSQVLILNGAQVAFGPPSTTLTEPNLQRAFGHLGHRHALLAQG